MGNRVNYVFLPDESNSNEAVTVLYIHSARNNGADDLALALDKARPRWSDPYYGKRIIISQLIGEDLWDSEIGAGLFSIKEYDPKIGQWNDNQDILIRFDKEEVCLEGNWHPFNSFIEYYNEVDRFHNV